MNLKGVPKLTASPLTGSWFRALNFRYYKTRLDTTHTKTTPSRFSPASPFQPLYRILYLAEKHQVAAYETEALSGSPSNPSVTSKASWLFLSLDVKLHKILDLCSKESMRLLGTSEQELTGKWGNSTGIVPTQALGVAIFNAAGIEGFLYPSSRVDGRNLVLFPDKLERMSSVSFLNEHVNRLEKLT